MLEVAGSNPATSIVNKRGNMNVLLVLAGVLLGVFFTFAGQAIRSAYLDWRSRRNWVIAGRRWKQILDNVSYKRVSGHWTSKQLTLEEQLEDLQCRVTALFTGDTPIDFDETMEILKTSENRLSEVELDKHRERLADIAEHAYVPAEVLRTPREWVKAK